MTEAEIARERLTFLYKQVRNASMRLAYYEKELNDIMEQVKKNEAIVFQEYGYEQSEKILSELDKHLK